MWSKIALINTDISTNLITDHFNIPPLGLEYLKSNVDGVAEIHILDDSNIKMGFKKLRKELLAIKPDLVGLNCNFTCGVKQVLEYARFVKQTLPGESRVVLGGWHSTLTVDEVLHSPWVDIVVRGEAEHSFKEMIQKGSCENVAGISYKKDGAIIHNEDRPLIEDLDDLSFPDRTYRKFKNFTMVSVPFETIETSRGCPFSCRFCCIHEFYRSCWRSRTPINIIRELYEIRKVSNVDDIFIVDDNFMANIDRVKKFCELAIKSRLGFHFLFQARVDTIAKHPELVELMAKAGFWLVFIGIESMTEKGLRDMNKKITVNHTREAVKVLHDNNILIVGNVIVGSNLDATEEEILDSIEDAKKLGVDFLTFALLMPLPKTKIIEQLERENLLLTKDWTKYDYSTPVINTRVLDGKKLSRIRKKANLEAMVSQKIARLGTRILKSRGFLFGIVNLPRTIIFAIKTLITVLKLREYMN